MFWVLLGFVWFCFLFQPKSSCAGLTEAVIWPSLSRSEWQTQTCLGPVLWWRPWPRWHSSRDAHPASSLPLCHVPFSSSSSPLPLGYVAQWHEWLFGEPAPGTNPAEKSLLQCGLLHRQRGAARGWAGSPHAAARGDPHDPHSAFCHKKPQPWRRHFPHA